jgi:phenylalanyl-tRNA synthetase beta chain
VAANQRHTDRQRLFEIGSVFLPVAGVPLPDEPRHLAIALTGAREVPAWQDGPAGRKNTTLMDFFDLKGVLETLVERLRLPANSLVFKPEEHGTFHPGRCAGLHLRGARIGVVGEIHPLVREAYDLKAPVVAAEIDLETLIADLPRVDKIASIPTQPAVYQDIALIVSEAMPASTVEATIRAAGGDLLRDASLFDVYRGDPIPPGQKSLAYALTYQAEDRTLTDAEVAKVHQQIVKATERQLGAVLRA